MHCPVEMRGMPHLHTKLHPIMQHVYYQGVGILLFPSLKDFVALSLPFIPIKIPLENALPYTVTCIQNLLQFSVDLMTMDFQRSLQFFKKNFEKLVICNGQETQKK